MSYTAFEAMRTAVGGAETAAGVAVMAPASSSTPAVAAVNSFYASRDEMQSALAGRDFANGTLFYAGGAFYQFDEDFTHAEALAGYKPAFNVQPAHFNWAPGADTDGRNDQRANALRDYVDSISAGGGAQYPIAGQLPVYIPGGQWTVRESRSYKMVFQSASFVRIYGDGYISQLDHIGIRFADRDWDAVIENMSFIGSGDYALLFEQASHRAVVNKVMVRDKSHTSYGGITVGDPIARDNRYDKVSNIRLTDCYIHRCGIGFAYADGGDTTLTTTHIMNCSDTCGDISGPGQLKMINCDIQQGGTRGNWEVRGDATKSSVEHYFTGTSFSNAQSGKSRKPLITSIIASPVAYNGQAAGHYVRVTCSAPHTLSRIANKIGVSGGTYTTADQGTEARRQPYEVLGIISDRIVDLSIPYTANDTPTGAFLLVEGWDFSVIADDHAQDVNDLQVTGGNSNKTRIVGGLNIHFNGTRLKEETYMESTRTGHHPHMIRFSITRGRGNDDMVFPFPHGPSAGQGWAADGWFDSENGDPAYQLTATTRFGTFTPHTPDGVGADTHPVTINEDAAYRDKRRMTVGATVVEITATGMTINGQAVQTA